MLAVPRAAFAIGFVLLRATTLALAPASSCTALVSSVTWLETAPPAWDNWLRRLLYLPLVLPAVFWVLGIHATALLSQRLVMAWLNCWRAVPAPWLRLRQRARLPEYRGALQQPAPGP